MERPPVVMRVCLRCLAAASATVLLVAGAFAGTWALYGMTLAGGTPLVECALLALAFAVLSLAGTLMGAAARGRPPAPMETPGWSAAAMLIGLFVLLPLLWWL